jgi:hypothetical protein
MKRMFALVALLLVTGFVSHGLAQGVQTGIMRGIVKDQQGLAIPGVTVTVTSQALQGQRLVVTGTDGGFTLQSLPPGAYEARFELPGFAPVNQTMTVPLGGVAEATITLRAAGIAEQVQVTVEKPAPIATPVIGENFKHEEIEALATPRTLDGIAQLSPGLTENSPNQRQVVINGAFAFDNVFMLNGVDVNDNLFGNPQNLFIEDAIQETQVLTSGIGAEYGRFTGGVINAITKSGGNAFSGSFRTNFSNPSWTKETPFALQKGNLNQSKLSESYEGTLGGPIVKDRLWFFGAGRWSTAPVSEPLPVTNTPHVTTTKNRRGEVKLTGTVAQNHTIQGGYLNNHNADQNVTPGHFTFTLDRASLLPNEVEPNWYYYTNYHGVLSSNLLVEAQFSERKFSFVNAGGSNTAILESPFITLNQALGQFNAPYFDATDPEARNNRQVTGNLTYFLNKAGRHQVKSGFEWFRSQHTGGNSQSATNYVFNADYAVDANGGPLFDSNGFLEPVFDPGQTQLQHWLPQRGSVLNVDTSSVYVQDHWAINARLSADVGARFEHARSVATPGNIQGVNVNGLVPRLAAAYDVAGNGTHVVHVTYGWYSGRYNEAQIGNNTNVGNPDLVVGVYNGPAGQGRSFAPGFNTANYQTVFGSFPTANIIFDPGLKAPIVREFSTSYGVNIKNGLGYLEGGYVHRRTVNLIEDFIQLSNGVTHVVQQGVDAGTFTNHLWKNTDLANRVYDGLVFQGRYGLSNRWSVNGHYTLQLRNDGNYEGEAANQPGITSIIGDYPEAFNAARNYPDGHLQDFERHRLRLWSIYTFGLGHLGDLSVSGLWRVDSGQVYSLVARSQPLSSIQQTLLAAYPDQPASQDIYFGARGSQFFNGYGLLDTSINYNVPVAGSLRPWVKFDVYNLFNNQKLIQFNTSVLPDKNSPKDALGLPTGFVQGPHFGTAERNSDFPVPFTTLTGGRTLRLAVGFRF